MYPLESVYSHADDAQSRSAIVRGIQQFVGRKYDYTPRNELEEQYAYYPADDGREDPQPGLALGDQRR